LHELGGLDPDACEAAALAHDIGHPPFGHVGEEVLDRIAREELDLRDGFEGNAQSMRILTTGMLRDTETQGLDLSCATLAGVAKYPWTRGTPPCSDQDRTVPGASINTKKRCPNGGDCGVECRQQRTWKKFNFYAEHENLLAETREFSTVGTGIQTLEASVMDLADDISYAVHDLEDFLLSGIIDHNRVLESLEDFNTRDNTDGPLASFASSLDVKYGGRYDAKDFNDSVRYVQGRLTSLFATLYRDSKASHSLKAAKVAMFASSEIGEYVNPNAIAFSTEPLWGDYGPHISLISPLWHRVQILKWITRTFIIGEADIALLQRGQRHILEGLVRNLISWAADKEDRDRLPRQLFEQLEIAEKLASGEYKVGYGAEQHAPRGNPNRAILDYVCTLSDGQCVALFEKLSGTRVHSGGIKESF